MRARRGRRLAAQGEAWRGPRPRVSVLVPAWNEEVGIEATVRSILASDYEDLEVVVVDDGSTDSTYSLLQALAAGQGGTGAPAQLVVHRQENAGKSRAMNTALGLATARSGSRSTQTRWSIREPCPASLSCSRTSG